MLYIFLDIDGVLNTSSEWKRMYSLNSNCIRNFAEFINKTKTDVRIVLTSSWRTGFSYSQESLPHIISLEQELKKYDLKIYGKTPVSKENSREKEIAEYINLYDVKKYIIIDDDKSLFPNIKQHLYFTDARTGFTQKDIKAILKEINK